MKRSVVIAQAVLLIVAMVIVVAILVKYQALKTAVSELQLRQGQMQSNVALMQMAITDNKSVVDNLNTAYRFICGPTGMVSDSKIPETTRTELLSACGASGIGSGAWATTLEFFKIYNAALSLRLQAQSDHDFEAVRNQYAQAASLARKKTGSSPLVADQWLMRALEGQAYFLMRLGKYQDAERLAQESIALAGRNKSYDTYVFANLTKFKIACLSGSDAAAVPGQYTALVESLRAIQKKHAAATEYYKFAAQDLETAQDDAELRQLCSRYAIAR